LRAEDENPRLIQCRFHFCAEFHVLRAGLVPQPLTPDPPAMITDASDDSLDPHPAVRHANHSK
jgi:hypothetical protein